MQCVAGNHRMPRTRWRSCVRSETLTFGSSCGGFVQQQGSRPLQQGPGHEKRWRWPRRGWRRSAHRRVVSQGLAADVVPRKVLIPAIQQCSATHVPSFSCLLHFNLRTGVPHEPSLSSGDLFTPSSQSIGSPRVHEALRLTHL